STIGTPRSAGNVRRDFRVICEKAGLGKEWSPRELRHSFVSMLSADGVATEDISHLVGHSSTRTTERVYRHELRPVLRTGAERMGRIFSQRSGTWQSVWLYDDLQQDLYSVGPVELRGLEPLASCMPCKRSTN